MAEFSIVIVSADTGRKMQAAAALGQALGVPPDAVLPVFDAAPMVLFTSLNFRQGRKIMQILTPVAAAGAVLLLAEGNGGGLSAVTCPGEPVLAGRPISSYSILSHGLTCPACGTPLEADIRILEQATPIHGGPSLPDVPMLPKDEMMPAPGALRRKSSAALNIADVEKVWKERAAASSGIHPPAQPVQSKTSIAGAPPKPSSSDLMRAIDSAPPLSQDASSQFDVLASGSSNPRLPEIVARVRNIPIAEARTIARKRLVPVAKAVDHATAKAVSDELEKINIKSRIVPRHPSGNIPSADSSEGT